MALVAEPLVMRELPREAQVEDEAAETECLDHWENRYVKFGTIAEGNYGVVEMMKDKVTGAFVAVKTSPLLTEEGLSSSSLREMTALTHCSNHPNVVKLLDIHSLPTSVPCSFTDKVHLVLELMQYNLHDFMKSVLRGPFKHEQLQPAFRQILEGVTHCHRQGYMHRDLKPHNILVHGNGDTAIFKITDFGLARRFQPLHVGRGPITKYVVTLWYRAPELMLMNKEQCMYGQGVDIWSLGCILAEMATQKPLFAGDSEIDTLFKIFQLKGTPTDETWPVLKQLGYFSRLWPRWKGSGLESVIAASPDEHPFLKDMLSKMLEYPPEQRWSAHSLLTHQFLKPDSAKLRQSATEA